MALGLLVLLGASVASDAGGSAANGFGSDWLSYGENAQLTNYVATPAVVRSVAAPAPAGGNSVPSRLLWTAELDGAVYASPLAVGGVATATGIRDLVIAETEAGTLYALDAHDGSVVWQRSFRTETTAG